MSLAGLGLVHLLVMAKEICPIASPAERPLKQTKGGFLKMCLAWDMLECRR